MHKPKGLSCTTDYGKDIIMPTRTVFVKGKGYDRNGQPWFIAEGPHGDVLDFDTKRLIMTINNKYEIFGLNGEKRYVVQDGGAIIDLRNGGRCGTFHRW